MNSDLKKIKIVFFGTSNICLPILEALKSSSMTPVVVITGEDKPSGRGLKLAPTPVSIWAEGNKIPVLKPKKLDDDFIENLKKACHVKNSFENFLYVVVAYGKIIPEKIINLPEYGTLNVHYSLLPRYRGASPVEHALLNGDSKTGVCIQKMVYKLDAGDILKEIVVDIKEKENKIELLGRLNKIASEILPETIKEYINNKIIGNVQDETLVTLAPKIDKSEGEINLNEDPIKNWRKYKAFFGYPGTFIFIEKDGQKTRLKITDADFLEGKFLIKKVVPEGKKEIKFDTWLKSKKSH